MYPALSSLTLVEDTDLTVSRKGYHPEIEGVISKDGETIKFSEKLKVRLGAEHWVKCIGLHLKFTLRSYARRFPHNQKTTVQKIRNQWEQTSQDVPTHLVIIGIHAELCKLLVENENIDMNELKETFECMKEFSLDSIKAQGFNELKKNREIAKLFQLEYYLDLLNR